MSLLDFFYPQHCLCCGYLGTYLCSNCVSGLSPFEKQPCFYCGRPSAAGLTHPACRHKNGIAACTYLFHYNPTLKKVIKSLKYRLVTEAFAEVMPLLFYTACDSLSSLRCWQRLRGNSEISVQPVPLHPLKLRERGFNQAEIVGRYLSTCFRWPVVDMVRRIRYTQTQAQQENRRDRRRNLSGAFVTSLKSEPPTGSNNLVILVDDVVTSGITITEAAKAVRAGDIAVFALAKG